MMAKATAAVAAGAVALLAVSGPPSGGDRVPRAEAATRPPAVQDRPDAGKETTRAAILAAQVRDAREPRAGGPRRGARDDGGAQGRRGPVRTAAGPGAAQGGSGGDDDDDEGSTPGRRVGDRATTTAEGTTMPRDPHAAPVGRR